jgi:SAM-dependent methyltransferase
LDPSHISVGGSLRGYWQRERDSTGRWAALRSLAQVGWDFFRGSLPDRKRQGYGDMEYDWEFRVDTTSATVSWRARLLGLMHSAYQPIEPDLFREIINSLEIDFSRFTFIDIGSGKGRALLLAAEYPFRRIVGVELLPELHSIAEENIRKYSSEKPACRDVQAVCADAGEYSFPAEPLVVFLFNPLPQAGLNQLVGNLEASLRENPRPVYVIYANPVFAEVVGSYSTLAQIGGTHQYAVFRNTI